MFEIENHRNLILKAFINFENLGYELIESKIEIKDDGFKRDQISVSYQSIDRTLEIYYFSNLNYLTALGNEKPIEYVSISMENRNVGSENNTDSNLNIVHYFRLKLPEIYLTELKLYNDSAKSGISLAEFERKITRYANIILEELKEVVAGKKWISASLTRLDGWRIETETGVKYYD